MSWLEKILYVDQSPPYRDHALYAGVVNATNTPTFVILPAGTSVTDINTALTNYEVVYLEPGTYTMGGTPISVGTNRALVGLGNASFGDTGGAYINGSAGATGSNFIQLNNGYLSNISCYVAAAQAHDIISGNTSNTANYVDRVNVTAAAANNNCAAFVGAFVKLDQFRVTLINGYYFSQSTISMYGPTSCTNFYISSAPTYGFVILNSWIKIDNGYIFGSSKATDYGIYCNNSTGYTNHWISNIRFYQCINGIYYGYTTNPSRRVFITNCEADGCTTGFYIFGPAQFSMSGCTSIGCSERGFYFQDIYYGTIHGCSGVACNGTAGVTYGNFYANACYDTTWVGIESYSANNGSGNTGFYALSLQWCSVSGFTSQIDYDGLHTNSCLYCTFTGLVAYDPGHDGINTDNSQRCSFSGISAYSCGRYGFYLNASTSVSVNSCTTISNASIGYVTLNSSRCTISDIVSESNASVGVYFDALSSADISNIWSYNNTGNGIQFSGTCTRINASGLSSVSNRGSSYHGIYIANVQHSHFDGMNTYDNQGCGLYIDYTYYTTYKGLTASYDDINGLYVNSLAQYCTFTGGMIYNAGGNGVNFNSTSCQYTIFSNFNEYASAGTYGMYFGTPLRSTFCDNKASSHGGVGQYGFYFLNNGTGYNQFHGNTYNTCTNGYPSGGGYGNWNYDDNYNQN